MYHASSDTIWSRPKYGTAGDSVAVEPPAVFRDFYNHNPDWYHGADGRAHYRKPTASATQPAPVDYSGKVSNFRALQAIMRPSRGFSSVVSAPRFEDFQQKGYISSINPDTSAQAANYQFAMLQYRDAMSKGAPAIKIAEIRTAPQMIVAPAQAQALMTDAQSLSGLRASQGVSTVLTARTKNLKTTSDVSQQVQKPVESEIIKALPWVIGGVVVLGLTGLILYRTRR